MFAPVSTCYFVPIQNRMSVADAAGRRLSYFSDGSLLFVSSRGGSPRRPWELSFAISNGCRLVTEKLFLGQQLQPCVRMGPSYSSLTAAFACSNVRPCLRPIRIKRRVAFGSRPNNLIRAITASRKTELWELRGFVDWGGTKQHACLRKVSGVLARTTWSVCVQ